MKMFRWLKETLTHKLEHLRWSNIKSLFRKHGLALVVIIVGWEIVEDILFPVLFDPFDFEQIWVGLIEHLLGKNQLLLVQASQVLEGTFHYLNQ